MTDASALLLIDRVHLDEQTFGDDALRRELLALFAAQCLRLEPLVGDVGSSPSDRADFAHTLKGSALGVGAQRIAAISAVIEDGLRGEGLAPEAALAALAASVAATLAEIGPAC